MATNRADTLDPALLRPGRLDRKIEFPMPDRRQKRLVFQVSRLQFEASVSQRYLPILALNAFCSPPCLSSSIRASCFKMGLVRGS